MRFATRATWAQAGRCLLCAIALGWTQTGYAQTVTTGRKQLATATAVALAPVQPTINGVASSQARVSTDSVQPYASRDGVAGTGTPPGFTVYENTFSGSADYFTPGANRRMADDLTLANGACSAVHYSLVVWAPDRTPDFDVFTELWDGDPCDPTSAAIAGTDATFTAVPAGGTSGWLLEVEFAAAPVAIPETVWLAATFSTADAGWVVAGVAETGSTANFWSWVHPDAGCGLYQFTGATAPHAGFYASVNCDLTQAPTGACCEGTACTEKTQAECLGFFRGPFTTCSPDPCTPGTCCGGIDFDECTDGNAADCLDGVFTPNATCSVEACGNNFRGYANTFNTGFFNPIDLNNLGEQVLWADDITLEPGAVCELLGFDVLVTGGGTGAPDTFNAHVELRYNVPGDLTNPFDDHPQDLPNGLIPGTARDFPNLDSDFLPKRLLVSVPPGTVLPDRFWVLLSTSAPTPGVDSSAGPLLGGMAKVGFSDDFFAVFNSSEFGAGVWFNGVFFGGFVPDSCPGGELCSPAGSIRANVWCRGSALAGACCDDISGQCIDGVTQVECPGRWQAGVTCDSAAFTPACGTNACCFPNPLLPGAFVCDDSTIEECATLNGSSSLGQFCGDLGGECPSNACVGGDVPGNPCRDDVDCGRGGSCVGCQNQVGDCFAANSTPGCDDPFCCQAVGAIDDFCVTNLWDENCAARAQDICTRFPTNDDFGSPEPIAGEGVFEFDNTVATMDGPNHASCADFGDTTTANDVWYCWTAPCTGTVFLETCNRTTLDTKVAVYDGCGTPSDANLLGCNDDGCNLQSRLVFEATAENQYLVRIGTFPGTSGGTGAFSVTCSAAGCPGTGDCCADNTGTTGCNDTSCCSRVCACDPFCCETDWDAACATTGFEGNGCGAELLCTGLCGTGCPDGPVTFDDPADGFVDAGYPHDPANAASLRTVSEFHVTAPVGADSTDCWTLCETAAVGAANSIASVVDHGGGSYTLLLARPMTPGAVTTITYVTNGTYGVFTSHPANVNGDSAAGAADVLAMIDCLNGLNTAVNCPWDGYSSDVDRSTATNAADVLAVIDLLNGAAAFDSWNNTTRPDAAACLP